MIFVADLHTDVNTQKSIETHISHHWKLQCKVYYCNMYILITKSQTIYF